MINLFTPKSGLIKLIGSFALICLFMGIQAAYSQILPDSLITDSLRGIKAIKAADVNGDGNLDLVIAASSGDNVWFVSGNGDLTFNTAEMVTDLADRVQDVTTGDLDSDGDLDIISAEDDNDIVAWFENDGMGTWTRTELSITMERCRSVNVGDIDGDGDMDVVATAWNNDKVVWFENTDSLGTFSGEILIGEPNAPADCALADIDGDGDLDIVSNSKNDDDLFWYENTDGMGTFSAEKFIDEGGLDKAYSIAVGDVNGDGYLDVICSAEGDDIHLYNNTDGLGSFSTATKIDSAANDCREIVLSDIDGDGDLDLMMGSNDGDFHGYYINDAGTFGARVDFNTQDEEAYCIVAADFDKDGDNDIITGHTSSTSGGLVNNIRLWENVCGLMITGQPIAPTDSMEGSTFKFGVGTSVSSVSFQWEKDGIALVDSGSVSGSATDTLTITNAMAADEGEYMARVTIDQTGCLTEVTSDTVEIALIISSNEAPYEVSFKLGPNPAKTYVKVVDLAENGLIKLIDINGKVILNQVHNANQLNHKLDVSNLPRGYYYLNFEGSKGTYTQKLHIQ